MILRHAFFRRDPLTCSRELVGCELHWGECRGLIVETEAYDAEGDEACHTFFRPSTRAFVAGHPAGTAYVYLNYGMHWMLNVLVKGNREGFVLIRALEPLAGQDLMQAARGMPDPRQWCSGPGKLARALGITGADHGRDLCIDERFAFHRPRRKIAVEATPRIGITKATELLWRFSVPGHPHVSGSRKKTRPVETSPTGLANRLA